MAQRIEVLLEKQNIRKKEKYLNILADFVGFEEECFTPTLIERSFGELLRSYGDRQGIQNTYNLRGNLRRDLKTLKELGIIEHEKGEKYQVSPKWEDVAFQSLIHRKITNLEGYGLFKRFGMYFFGIKEGWNRYPEFMQLMNILQDSLPLWNRLNMIKQTLLIREFGEKWREFLNKDIDSFVKFWLWRVAFTFYGNTDYPKKDHTKDNIDFYLEFFHDRNKSIKFEEKRKKFNKKLEKRFQFSKRDSPFRDRQERLKQIVLQYDEAYARIIFENIEQMDDEAKNSVQDMLDHIFDIGRNPLRDVGVYIDVPDSKSWGSHYRHTRFLKRYTDETDNFFKENEFYRKLHDGKEKIELDQEKDFYRFSEALCEEITMPQIALYMNPQLDKIIDRAIAVLEEDEKERKIIQYIKEQSDDPRGQLVMEVLSQDDIRLESYKFWLMENKNKR